MKIQQLFEGAEPKLPGAPKGVQIMTPQQFVAKAGDMPGEESEGVAEGSLNEGQYEMMMRNGQVKKFVAKDDADAKRIAAGYGAKSLIRLKGGVPAGKVSEQGVAEDQLDEAKIASSEDEDFFHKGKKVGSITKITLKDGMVYYRASAGNSHISGSDTRQEALKDLKELLRREKEQGVTEGSDGTVSFREMIDVVDQHYPKYYAELSSSDISEKQFERAIVNAYKAIIKKQGVAEGEEHLARIRRLSGLDEATKLPASSREFGGDEFQDYMKRIVGTPDIDKKTGQVKTDKKGNEKYVSGKTKSDRYKMPYIHRSSVIEYLSPDGKTYDEDLVKKTLAIRPKSLLKQNEKMKHSNGEFEQFFNVGFAALTGIALDEETNNLIIVNTCPGAGSCKVDCFAMKGGKVQFQGPWQSDGRILTYLLNDPDGFFNQLSAEITKESEAGKKGDKKFPNGWQTTVRWHDAGDFFSPEYLDLALKMAAKHPDVKFYAYTKMAGAALAKKPDNFIINWSEGAHTSQEKQVKAQDPSLDTTKNSRIVPDELFQDLLVKDEKKNLVKGAQGQWQVQPNKLPELKQRLAKQYGLSANSILDYNEYMAKRKSIPAGMKYNVIVAPGEGDISANDPNIISTLLLKH